MAKYLVETVDFFRMRYVIECESAEHAKDVVTLNEVEEFSQLHLDETIISARIIDDAEYLRTFDEDNNYAKDWPEEQKFNSVYEVIYNIPNPDMKELDPDLREWEYDGCGIKVWKGTRRIYKKVEYGTK
jgi:predicted RNA methylase